MTNGTEMFRTDKWVLRSRRDDYCGVTCLIIHECDRRSDTRTLSGVYHPPTSVKSMVWHCQKCNEKATDDIITVWLMLNWEKLHGNI